MTALILHRPDPQTGPLTFEQFRTLSVDQEPGAVARRNEVLARARELEQIISPKAYDIGVALMRELKALVSDAEKSRKTVKGPIDELVEKIQSAAKGFSQPVESEIKRLQEALNAYASEQARIAAAEQRKRDEELARLEAERKAAEQAAQLATTKEEVESAIAEQKAIQAKEAAAMSAPEARKVAGTANTPVPRWEVEDIQLLHDHGRKIGRQLTNIEPNSREIDRLVRSGAKEIPGLKNVRMELDVRVRRP